MSTSRLHRLAICCTLLVAAVVTFNASGTPHVGAIAPKSKRVMLVTDSVGLGTRGILPDAFPADWDVSIVGKPASFVNQLEQNYVIPNLSRAGDHVVIAGGYNYPFWDPARFDREVDSIINTLTSAGVKHVYWVTLREVKPQFISDSAWRQVQRYYWYFPTVNQHLEAAVERHANLTLIDWAAAADQPGITYDAIHLNTTGARLYSSLIAQAVSDAESRSPNNGITRVNVATPAQVASGEVTAVAVNLTSVRSRTRGFLSAFPCEQSSADSSNLNFVRDQVVAAAAIVPVGPSGDICVSARTATHVVIDTFGTFGAAAELSTTTTERMLDTRPGPRQPALTERRVRVATGAGDLSRSVAINVTVAQPASGGYLSVHDCGAGLPDTSNLNFRAGQAVPNLVIAQADAAGDVCMTATADVHLIVDLLASFGPTSTVQSAAAARLVDTRGGAAPKQGEVITISMPPGTPVGGVVANLTIARATARGFASVYPCSSGPPPSSNLNYVAGAAIANAVIVQPDADGRLCVRTSSPAEVIFDVFATLGDGFDGTVPRRAIDTRDR